MGDMFASVYDPGNVASDAFSSANHAYDNGASGLTAATTQGAIAEIAPAVTRMRANVASVLSDEAFAYAGSDKTVVAPGDFVRTFEGNFTYQVVASDAAEYHVETEGGVRLLVVGKTVHVDALGARPDDDTFNNSPIINRAVALAGFDIRVGQGRYYCTDTVAIPRGALSCNSFWGMGLLSTVFDFSGAADEATCFSIGGDGNYSRKGPFGGFTIDGKFGSSGTTALRLNPSGNIINPVTRFRLDDVCARNHRYALSSRYSWINTFINFEAFNCWHVLDATTQSNEFTFVSPIFMNNDGYGRLSNCESWLMLNPTWQNINSGSSATFAMGLAQSALTIINPYIEGLGNRDTVHIGNPGDSTPSTLIIVGGQATEGGRVRYRGRYNHHIEVNGIRCGGTGDTTFRVLADFAQLATLPATTRCSYTSPTAAGRPRDAELLQSIGRSARGFANQNVAPVPSTFYTTINRSSGTFAHTATPALVAEEPYTIVMLARKQDAGSTRGGLRFRSSPGGTIINTYTTDLLFNPGEPLSVKYLPFIAEGVQLDILLDTNVPIDFYLWRLYRGTVFPQVDPFTLDIPADTGWTAMTGTASKGALVTYDATSAAGAAYDQAEVQAIATALQSVSQRLKAHEDALISGRIISS